MNPTLSSLRNEILPHQRLPTYEHSCKRPRLNPIVVPHHQNLHDLNELPLKHRKLTDGRSLPLPTRTSLSQNRVTISSLLSMRPSGTSALTDKPHLPTLRQVLRPPVPAKSANRSETLSPLSLESIPKAVSKHDPVRHSGNDFASSPVSSRQDAPKENLTMQRSSKFSEQAIIVPSGPKRKVIPCPYEFCQKKFSRNSNLKVHMRIHTKTYPFACNLCEREFMWSSSLHWHTKWHEKMALREAAKQKSPGGLGLTGGGNGQGCTCTCVCPVHKMKPVSARESVLDNAKRHSLPQIDVPLSQ